MSHTFQCKRCECDCKTKFPQHVQPVVKEYKNVFDNEYCLSDDDDEQLVFYDDIDKVFVGEGRFAVDLANGQSPLCNKLDLKVHGFCKKCLTLAQKDEQNIEAMQKLFDVSREFVFEMLLPCDLQESKAQWGDDIACVTKNNATLRLLYESQQQRLLRDFQKAWLQNVAGLPLDVAQQIISKCSMSADYEVYAGVGDLHNTQWLQQLKQNVFVSALHSVQHVIDNLSRIQLNKKMRVV